jgi:TnpA family transposase
VDWDIIERHWHDMIQVVLSIQAGTVLPSMLLQKLGVYSRHSSLYKAFSALGRVERTLFLLDYMSDAAMRQHIRAETISLRTGLRLVGRCCAVVIRSNQRSGSNIGTW